MTKTTFKRRLITFLLILVGTPLVLFLAFGTVLTFATYSNTRKLVQKANDGDRSSQKTLGYLYESGIYASSTFGLTSKDETKAIYWYTKAVEERTNALPGPGPPRVKQARQYEVRREASFDIARLYERRKSPMDAVKWYIKSATMGDGDAAQRLSLIYELGELGQAVNMEKAAYWRKRSKNETRVQD